jgi:predicted nucleic acid-binding protein
MTVLLDTGILYAPFDREDAWHDRAVTFILAEEGSLIIPSPVIPEVDYLLEKRVGRVAQMRFYRGLREGHYFVVDLPRDRYARIEELNRRFADLSLGFVDAAVVAISEFLRIPRIATIDRRHFTPLAAAFGLELLP